MVNYKIEAYSFDIPGVPAVHDFCVLSNVDTGEVIAELHGLATARVDIYKNGVIEYKAGTPVPIGTDPKLYSLQVYQFVHNSNYAAELGVAPNISDLFDTTTNTHTVFTGSKEEAFGRWGAAVDVIPLLNNLDLDYPAYGFNVFSKSGKRGQNYYFRASINSIKSPFFLRKRSTTGLSRRQPSNNGSGLVKNRFDHRGQDILSDAPGSDGGTKCRGKDI